MTEANELKGAAESRKGERSHMGLGVPKKIAITTLIMFFGVSAFVYIANHGTQIMVEFLRAN